jgi:ATP-binding cassette subfamily C (CFTR/MRP) protein 4
MLWYKIGVAGLIGLFLSLSYAVVSSQLYKRMAPLKYKIYGMADERMRLLSNLVEGMRIVKMYSWEAAFYRLIFSTRTKEIGLEYQRSALKSFSLMLFSNGHALTWLVTFVIYNQLGNELVLADVFAVISILSVVHFYASGMMMFGISTLFMILISAKRLTQLLLQDEVSKQVEEPDQDTSVSFREAEISWEKDNTLAVSTISPLNSESATFKLYDIDFQVTPGSLCVVVGAVGAGKSSLLMSLMGELNVTRGEVRACGSLAYVEQEPWVLSATFKENILMDKELNEPFYKEVLDVCCLTDDIAAQNAGDQTVIGDRGITLSGGQKARLALARAVYVDRDIYLLDDPLSAVDARVSRSLFNKCIVGALRHRTRLLVTHQLQYLSSADIIIILHKGSVAFSGSCEALKANETVMDLIGQIIDYRDEDADEEEKPQDLEAQKKDTLSIVEEERAEGAIPWKLYWEFLHYSYNSSS